MVSTFTRYAIVAAAVIATTACAVHDTETPPVSGPSALSLTLTVNAIPDAISQDGGSQSSIKVNAIGPDGRGISALPMRMDMSVAGSQGDYGTLSARTIVTNSDGVATVVYTAPPSPSNGVFGTCRSLPGTCVSIIATATGTNFGTTSPASVTIRLVPPGVILPPIQTPTPSFVVTPTAPSANSPVQFDASASCGGPLSGSVCPVASPSITQFAWNFGDGQTGTGRNVTHSFALQQTYTVMLTVTNELGASASKTQVISTGAGSLPLANFTFSPTQPGVGELVFFNGMGSTAGQGHTIASYRWTFGDGGTASGANVSHAYATAGTYAVQLTVTDDAGQSVTSGSQNVSVGNPPSPSANFTFSPGAPAIGDTVVFDWRTTTTAQGARIVSLDWNFGDGTPVVHCPGDPACTSNGITTHVFRVQGTFNVNLIVTDSAGRIGSKSTSINVGLGLPNVVITASPSSPTPNMQVNFNSDGTTYAGSATPVSFLWSFGDGTPTSTVANPTHAFGAAGTYNVRLSVTDSQNRTGTAALSVTVVPFAAPIADFVFSPAAPHTGNTVNFTSTSSTPSGAPIVSYSWNFGDATSCSNGTCAPSATNPSHVYVVAAPGTVTFNVTLTIRDSNGLTSSKTVSVPVTNP
jgi:PKD repeat protein